MAAASGGDTSSSASMHRTQSFRARDAAKRFCGPKPRHASSTTRAPKRRATSRVASSLPESTTTISSTNDNERRQEASCSPVLNVINTADSGRGATGIFERKETEEEMAGVGRIRRALVKAAGLCHTVRRTRNRTPAPTPRSQASIR